MASSIASSRFQAPAITRAPVRPSRRLGVCASARLDSYVSPSSRTGATELAVLQRYSEVSPAFPP